MPLAVTCCVTVPFGGLRTDALLLRMQRCPEIPGGKRGQAGHLSSVQGHPRCHSRNLSPIQSGIWRQVVRSGNRPLELKRPVRIRRRRPSARSLCARCGRLPKGRLRQRQAHLSRGRARAAPFPIFRDFSCFPLAAWVTSYPGHIPSALDEFRHASLKATGVQVG